MGKRKRSKTAPSNKAFDLEDARKVLRQLKQKEQELLKKQNKLLRKIKQLATLLVCTAIRSIKPEVVSEIISIQTIFAKRFT